MVVSSEKKRVMLTFPTDALESFKADAKRLNMTLSSYAYVVLAANSYSLNDDLACEMCDRLALLTEQAVEREDPEYWAAWKADIDEKKKSGSIKKARATVRFE